MGKWHEEGKSESNSDKQFVKAVERFRTAEPKYTLEEAVNKIMACDDLWLSNGSGNEITETQVLALLNSKEKNGE